MIQCSPKVYLLVYQQLCFSRKFYLENKLGEVGGRQIFSDNYDLGRRYSPRARRPGCRSNLNAEGDKILV